MQELSVLLTGREERLSRSKSLHINLNPLQMRGAKTPCSSAFRYCPGFNAVISLIVSATPL